MQLQIGSGQLKYGGEFYEFAGDARSNALGNAVVSIYNGPVSIFHNPALLQINQSDDLVFSHQNRFSGVLSRDLFAYTFRTKNKLIFSIGLIRRAVDDIANTSDALSSFIGDIPYLDYDEITHFSHHEIGMIISFARKLSEERNIGLNIKPKYLALGEHYAWGLGIDIGYCLKRNKSITIGVLLQDIPFSYQCWNTKMEERSAPRMIVGLSRKYKNFLFSFDLSDRLGQEYSSNNLVVFGQSINYAAGLEYNYRRIFFLRVGSSSLSPFSGGFGINQKLVNFAYAYISPPVGSLLSDSHQFSITLHLDEIGNLGKYFDH